MVKRGTKLFDFISLDLPCKILIHVTLNCLALKIISIKFIRFTRKPFLNRFECCCCSFNYVHLGPSNYTINAPKYLLNNRERERERNTEKVFKILTYTF